MFKIQITEKGVHMAVGDKEQELPKGHIMEVEKIPGWLVNKCRELSDTADKELVTAEQPIEPPSSDDVDAWRVYYRHLSGGKEPDKRWGVPKLREAVAELTDGSNDNGE